MAVEAAGPLFRSAQLGNPRRDWERCGAALSTGKNWIWEQILLDVEGRGCERQEGKRDTGRAGKMLWYWWEIHGQLVRDWWTGCWSGRVFEDEVVPGNFPCSLWGGSLILMVQEGD